MQRTSCLFEDEVGLPADDGLSFLISEMSLTDSSSVYQNDSSIASLLEMQQQLFFEHQHRQSDSETMTDAITWKAWRFVERLIQLCQSLPNQGGSIHPVSFDGLVDFAERLMMTQRKFCKEGRPVQIDIGYHYTSTENRESIRNDGLKPVIDRNGSQVGVFTGSDPYEFHGCGNVGLIIARLQGFHRNERPNDYDHLRGATVDDRYAVVLSSSSQCIPLVEYKADMIDMENERSNNNNLLYRYHYELQCLVDEFFNDGVNTQVSRPTKTPRRNGMKTYYHGDDSEGSGFKSDERRRRKIRPQG